ncbi:MAG: Rpn family recombination-promoting nuclease/putative transposase [Lachnospiraceae bacterium]
MNTQKSWEELELKDDFMFAKIMRDRTLCKKMLERLLEIEIEKIEYPEEQKTIDLSYDSRSIRLDLYVKDNKDTVYNVEIQTVDTKELPKRSRYYQGMIDLNLIEKGEPYQKLNRSYVIFICTFDLFGEGLYRYTFENLCREKTDLSLNDEAIKIFFNTSGTKGEITDEAKAFLKYVGGVSSEDSYVQELQAKINNAKRNEEWRREYMTLLMRDKENIEKGRLEGLAEGKAAGLAEGKAEEKKRIAKMLLQKGTFSDLDIAGMIGIPLEELLEIKNQ